MTNREHAVRELIKKHNQIETLENDILEIESGLAGAEIQYKDYDYTIIDHIDGHHVSLYCEYEDNIDSVEITITLDDLLEVISS
ncbi:hypothetical protein [Paenibacillus dendritiformis]|uniref:hypothetical protein n=1 Tax=Paenibacillus dendritiformis TaxID=130049 RepID=UPI00387E1901